MIDGYHWDLSTSIADIISLLILISGFVYFYKQYKQALFLNEKNLSFQKKLNINNRFNEWISDVSSVLVPLNNTSIISLHEKEQIINIFNRDLCRLFNTVINLTFSLIPISESMSGEEKDLFDDCIYELLHFLPRKIPISSIEKANLFIEEKRKQLSNIIYTFNRVYARIK